MVVSNILYFHPYLGKWSNLTKIFGMVWNHQLGYLLRTQMKLRDWNCETKAFDLNNVRSTTWNNVFLRCWVLSYPEINMNPWKWVDIQCTIESSMNFCRILAMNSLNRPTQQKLVWRSLTLPSSLVIWFSIGRLKNGAGRAKHVCPHLSDLGLCTLSKEFQIPVLKGISPCHASHWNWGG